MSTTAPDTRVSEYSPVVPTTEFPATFPVFDNSDIAVLVDGQPRADFSVTATYVYGVSTDAKAVFTSGVTGNVKVVGVRKPRRGNRFKNGAPLPIWEQNLALDAVEAELQEVRRDVDRSLKFPLKQDGQEIPAAEPGKVLGWSASGEVASLEVRTAGTATFGATGLQVAAAATPSDVLEVVKTDPITADTMLVDESDGSRRESRPFSYIAAKLQSFFDLRYLRITSRGYVDLSTDFGAPGAGSDFTNAWGQFLNACIFDAMKGEIPQGTFNVSEPMTRTCNAPFQSLTIEGKGRQTLLNFRGELGAALTMNYLTIFNCINISRLNVQTDSQSGALSAFRLICPAHPDPAAAEYNIFDDVVFKGIDGYKTAKHFGTCVYSYRVNNMNFERCRFNGPGAAIGDGNGRGNQVELQSQNGDYAVKYVFEKCYFSQFQNAILVGPYVQGIVLDGSDFVGGRAAYYVPPGQYGNDGLLVTGCHMNTREVGIEILATEATSMEVNNTFFIIDKVNQVGIRTAGYRWSVQNTHFEGQGSMAGAAGIHVISGAHHGIISGNQYGFMPNGNVLNTGCHDIKVLNNSYDNVVTPNVNNGTNNAIGIATA